MNVSASTRNGILVVGDIMLDEYIEGVVERISPEAPVPVLRKARHRHVPGGAANVAANIATMNGQVNLIGMVGQDEQAGLLRDFLGKLGVNTASLLIETERGTITKTRVVVGQQQIVRIDNEVTAPLSRESEDRLLGLARQALTFVSVMILSDYAKGVLTDRVITDLISMAKAQDVFVVVDPKRTDFSAYRGADLIKPNRGEFERACGIVINNDDNMADAMKVLAAQFDGHILVTRAEAGMTLMRRGIAPLHVRTAAREVADVSGAGDTALAALAVALSEGNSLEQGVVAANAAAGIAVGKLGTALVSRQELDAALSLSEQVYHAGACLPLDRAASLVESWKMTGETVVFTNGCFDLLHPGHIRILENSAHEGTRLIVGLNSDASVSRLKGPTRPVQTEKNRARVIGALRFVDLVIIFDEDTPLKLIETLRPHVLVKGADYTEGQVVGGDIVKAYGGRIVLVPLIEGQSSTILINRAGGRM